MNQTSTNIEGIRNSQGDCFLQEGNVEETFICFLFAC